MLKIKLARFGKRHQPHYRIVVNEARDKRDGSYVALLGHYAPTQTPKTLDLNVEEYDAWIKKGAQPTETVAALATRFKSGNPFPTKAQKPSKKALAKAQAEKEAAAQPKEEVTEAPTETPAEEAVTEEAPVEAAPAEATE